jgi:hypothetical protein
MTRYDTFFNLNAKMNRYGTFFNASWPIQKLHILLTQTNEKTCTFFGGR